MAAQWGGEKMTEGHDNFSAMQSRTAERRRLRLGKRRGGVFSASASSSPPFLLFWWNGTITLLFSLSTSSCHPRVRRPITHPGDRPEERGGETPSERERPEGEPTGQNASKRWEEKKFPENNIWDELRLLGKKCMCGFNKIMQQIELFRCCFNPRALT